MKDFRKIKEEVNESDFERFVTLVNKIKYDRKSILRKVWI